MSTPQTLIQICSGVGLNSRFEHSIHFESIEKQAAFFNTKVVKTLTGYSYIRRSWKLKVSAAMSDALTWDYLFFVNNHDRKRYYYFINRIEYVNDSTVSLDLELDVLQSYLFDFELLPCFVERQHTPTDEVGEHTVEEGLDTGEVYNAFNKTVGELNDLAVLVLSTINLKNVTANAKILASRYDNIFGGAALFAFDMSDWQSIGVLLNEGSVSESILTMWMYPKALIKLKDGETWTGGVIAKDIQSSDTLTVTSQRPLYITGRKPNGETFSYFPKNKKLLTYPYSFLYVTNNLGGAGVFRYERFTDPSSIEFTVSGALSPEGAIRISPENYNGYNSYENGLTLGGFPTCAWNSDTYKIWLAQNQNSQALSYGMSALSIVGGAASLIWGSKLAGAGMLAGGISSIANNLAANKDREAQPPQARGSQSASVNVVAGMQTFSLIRKQITHENAVILDDFFTMYGYKLNRVQVPSLKARPSFTYVKTVGCHIRAGFCNEDALKIESIFDNGVTFWTNGNKMGDYTQDNQPS